MAMDGRLTMVNRMNTNPNELTDSEYDEYIIEYAKVLEDADRANFNYWLGLDIDGNPLANESIKGE
jgi:hypothetical protein